MLKELFDKNRDIVINSDIDGFLCGMILQKYFDCRIVGFSDSKDTIWLIPEITDIDSPIFIDLYVARPNVICIEQHIIAYDSTHHNKIISYGSKFNPNLERRRTFVGDLDSDYYHKYPFGTVHYLIALMSKEGIDVTLPDLYKTHSVKQWTNPLQSVSTNLGQVILRVDDALYSTLSPYRENALDWWHWLDPNNKSSAILALRNYISSCEIPLAKQYKNEIGHFFKGLGCEGADGAFKRISDDSGNILPKVLNYNDVIGEMMGIRLNLPKQFNIHKGVYSLQYCRPGYDDMNVLNDPKLYSYAFIFGPHPRNPNFSFTLDMK